MKTKKHITVDRSLTLINRSISSNRWVSPLTARDNRLEFATISVFTQVSLVSKFIYRTLALGENTSSAVQVRLLTF